MAGEDAGLICQADGVGHNGLPAGEHGNILSQILVQICCIGGMIALYLVSI